MVDVFLGSISSDVSLVGPTARVATVLIAPAARIEMLLRHADWKDQMEEEIAK